MTRLVQGLAAACVAALPAAGAIGAQSDLDAFMQQVLARRDENWKKLQQYVLDERERIELRGPGGALLWGDRREYTWFIRDGFFVRSPLIFNGVTIAEPERRQYEAEFLRREKRRESGSGGIPASGPARADDEPSADAQAFILQTRQPQFISSAYFLRFQFEEGKYALVGREPLDGRDVLRIEYYPARLFGRVANAERRRGRKQERSSPEDRALNAELQRLMNKVALITLWVEPSAHQIVKYTFDNVALDFIPAQWLVRVDSLQATMTMNQPFTGVWLPRALDLTARLRFARGDFDVRYALDYQNYRVADVKAIVR